MSLLITKESRSDKYTDSTVINAQLFNMLPPKQQEEIINTLSKTSSNNGGVIDKISKVVKGTSKIISLTWQTSILLVKLSITCCIIYLAYNFNNYTKIIPVPAFFSFFA
jgi:hypothetical protein